MKSSFTCNWMCIISEITYHDFFVLSTVCFFRKKECSLNLDLPASILAQKFMRVRFFLAFTSPLSNKDAQRNQQHVKREMKREKERFVKDIFLFKEKERFVLTVVYYYW